MIIYDCEQGSTEWHMARASVITASMFRVARTKVNCLDERQQAYVNAVLAGKSSAEAMAIAGYKAAPKAEAIQRALDGEKVGDYSDAAKDYAFRLAVERISRQPLDDGGFETYAMRRGRELEPEARMEHEVQTGLLIQPCGFITTDDRAFGASADGLIEDDGGSEYKCLISPEEIRRIWFGDDWSKYTDQVQGSLWLTGRKYWEFCMYCPALAPIGKQLWRRRVERDEAYIEALEADLMEFKALVAETERRLREDVCA
ncbi:lambda exonuclease family protein [Herbaspirillum seropedicae]|uniref:lambda exonuclease family protein n=1 Tax=Herbaspirillum seropedicae TaxID=964 RepID=UPI003FCE3A2F